MTKLLTTFFVFLAMISCDCGGSDSTPKYTLTVAQDGKSAEVHIEVASTGSQRQQGLMLRQELADDAGMLFLFPRETQVGFWMRNTYVPLDIAYIGADGTVQEIRQAKPLDETVLVPAAAYRYVLEVNQGWFAAHGLGVGARVELPEGLPAATD